MNINIRHDGNDSYLILEEKADSEGETFSLRMITENQIPGLLHAGQHNLNDDRQLYYRISGMISMEELCGKKQLSYEQLKQLLLGLDTVLKQLEEYLLDADNLLLSPAHIYTSTLDQDLFFCLYPCAKTDIRGQIRSLCEYLLEHIDHEDEQVVGAAYQLYRLTREDHFELSQIVERLVRSTGSPQHEGEKETDVPVPESPESVKDENFEDSLPADTKSGGGRVVGLWACLAAASLVSMLLAFALKSYYYGYTFAQMMAEGEVTGSFIAFLGFLILTLYRWRHSKKLYIVNQKRVKMQRFL